MTRYVVLGGLGLAVALAACGDDKCGSEDAQCTGDGGGGGDGGGADAEVCEHMQDGPSAAVTPGVDIDSAGAIDDDHRRYDVALVEIAGQRGGVLSFASAEAGTYAFYFSQQVSIAITEVDGESPVMPLPTPHPASASCPGDVAISYEAQLGVGTFFLFFGPTAETEVSVVVEHGA